MMKKGRIALLLALLLCLSACGSADTEPEAPIPDSGIVAEADPKSPPEPADEPEEQETAGSASEEAAGADDFLRSDVPELADTESLSDPTPRVDIATVEHSFDADDGTQLVRYAGLNITVTVPGRPKAEERIQFDLDETTQLTSDEQLESQAQEDYDWAQEQGMDWIAYCDELDAVVVRADSHVLSLRFDVYTYTGGVHGYYYSYGVSYDAETGERLGLKNLSAGVTDLSSYARNVILAMCQTDEYKDLLYEDYKPYINDVIQDSHFYFTDDGLIFVAEPYLLGPYAAGQIEFPISYEDLSGVVKDIYLK